MQTPTHFQHDDLFGGKGRVLVWDLLGNAGLAPFTAVLACELAPGGSVGAHVQADYPEIVIFTAGEGRVEVGGISRPVAAGSLVALPLGQTLAISNASTEAALHYMIVKALDAQGSGQ